MTIRKRIVIAENERGLVFRDRQFVACLKPGVEYFWDPRNRIQVRVFDVTRAEVNDANVLNWLKGRADLIGVYFDEVRTNENQVALIRCDGQFIDLLAPQSRKVYWSEPLCVEAEIIDIAAQPRIDAATVRVLRKALAKGVLGQGVLVKQINSQCVGLLSIDGVHSEVLPAGTHAYWRFNRAIDIVEVDTRVQNMEISGQEILTRDKVSLRVNLSAAFRISDALAMVQQLSDSKAFLYTELQLAVRKAIGGKNLDALLADKSAIDTQVCAWVRKSLDGLGLQLLDVGLKDVILPGDMKAILNQVVEAEKAAKANVIKRREETAATRSLLNTAKLMDQSPTLRRLKELETLEKVSDKVASMTVFGGIESLLQDVIKVRQ